MSTAIYNAVRFHKDTTLDEVASWVASLRPLIQNALYEELEHKLLRLSIHELDKMTLEGCGWRSPPLGTYSWQESPFSRAMCVMREDKHVSSGKPHIEVAARASIRVIPYKGFLYGILNVPDAHVSKVWDARKWPDFFEDFAFWNNTDPPEDVTQKQWSQRRKVWDGIMKDIWSMNEAGMNFQLSQSFFLDRSFHRFMETWGGLTSETFSTSQTVADATPRPFIRVKKLHDCIDDAPWLLPSHANIGEVMKHLRDIDNNKIPSFAEACTFLTEHVLRPVQDITPATLFLSFGEMKNDMERLREKLFALHIPSSLMTPSFHKEYLTFHLPKGALSPSPLKL